MAKDQGMELGGELAQTLRLLRSQELQVAEREVKRRMLGMGRCPICTLAVPCNHYKTPSDLPPPTTNPQVPVQPLLHPLSPPKPLETVRFRGPTGIQYTKKRSKSENEGRKAENRRMKMMERLDRYREERLRREIAKIEEMKQREETERQETLAKDRRRQERDSQIKKELAAYQERRLREQQERQEQFLEASQREQAIRRRLNQRAQKQKQLLRSYRHKTEMITSIEREQVAELGIA